MKKEGDALKFKRVCSVYFSGTGTTKKIVTSLGKSLSKALDIQYFEYNFTPLDTRQKLLSFDKTDLVVFGTPVYAGRVPNVLLKYLSTIEGNDATAIPIVLFGNRNYDDALIELRDILENNNFKTIAAAAFVGEHAFSTVLGKNRPDSDDLTIINEFSKKIVDKITTTIDLTSPIKVKGTPYPYNGYYQPKKSNGDKIDIRKVKPITTDNCSNCGVCTSLCPMGSINPKDPKEIIGLCIKCCACVKGCPVEAKQFIDEGYIYHKNDLEKKYIEYKNPEVFI